MVLTRIRFLIIPLLSAWHCGPNIGFSSRGTDAPNRLFMNEVWVSVSPFNLYIKKINPSDLLCLRSSKSKYNFFSTLQPKKQTENLSRLNVKQLVWCNKQKEGLQGWRKHFHFVKKHLALSLSHTHWSCPTYEHTMVQMLIITQSCWL